ncbi:hypothetical protein LAZ67_6003160 [Cordylochernes scorpioides]|uniref:Uncharacterized protein n=1 Tax=Cordylochernes scorpioides TaxID=51811 RepID=A0ABY6KKB9_9ARAC|nr:hypothetical protein LAZ67_6003160 [Cordylochernes scorpioides]
MPLPSPTDIPNIIDFASHLHEISLRLPLLRLSAFSNFPACPLAYVTQPKPFKGSSTKYSKSNSWGLSSPTPESRRTLSEYKQLKTSQSLILSENFDVFWGLIFYSIQVFSFFPCGKPPFDQDCAINPIISTQPHNSTGFNRIRQRFDRILKIHFSADGCLEPHPLSEDFSVCQCDKVGTYAVLLTTFTPPAASSLPRYGGASLEVWAGIGCAIGALLVFVTGFTLLLAWRICLATADVYLVGIRLLPGDIGMLELLRHHFKVRRVVFLGILKPASQLHKLCKFLFSVFSFGLISLFQYFNGDGGYRAVNVCSTFRCSTHHLYRQNECSATTLWFKNDLKTITALQLKVISDWYVKENRQLRKEDYTKSCNTCRQSLNKRLPPLDPISERLVSPRLPFMQVRRLDVPSTEGHHHPHRQLLRHEHLPPLTRTSIQDPSRNPRLAPLTSTDDVPRQQPQKVIP